MRLPWCNPRTRRALAVAVSGLAASACGPRHDLVLEGGRVMDPESGLDGVRWVAIDGGRVTAISERRLRGRERVDVSGLVVAPGFIDLGAHGEDAASDGLRALDGVTTVVELEHGVYPVGTWYQARAGRAVINFGAAVSHAGARLSVTPGPGPDPRARALTGSEMEELVRRMRKELADGGIGFGFDLAFTPGATPAEIEDLFGVAGFDRAPVFVRPGDPGPGQLDPVLLAAARMGAPLHVVPSDALAGTDLAALLELVDRARVEGVDVTVQLHPFDGGAAGIAHPGVIVASPAGSTEEPDRSHRTGTFARVLGRHVRGGPLTLMDALARMTNLPARRIERIAPAFRAKGRVRVGADADLTIFDPETVLDRATEADRALGPAGIRHVLVGGTFVVRDGEPVAGARPGKPIRAVGWM